MIYSLQSMRFIAIFSIFLSHLSFLRYTQYSNVYNRWFSGGNFGVSFFLILSGFLLAYNYYGRLYKVNFEFAVEFTKKRIKKFYPLYLITMIVYIPNYLISYFANPIFEIPLLILNIFMLKSYIPSDVAYFSYNAVSWFLSTIILLYFLFPYIMNFFSKKLKNIEYRSLIFMIAIYLLAVYLIVTSKQDNQYTKWFFYISPFFRIFDFSIGILCGIFVKCSTKKIADCNKNIKVIFSILEIISIIAFVVAYSHNINIDKYFRYGMYYIPLLSIIVIIFGYEKGIISHLLNNKLSLFLSSISFEFFLIHNIIITNLSNFIGQKAPLITCIISLTISIALSIIAKKFIDNDKVFVRMGLIFKKISTI